MDIFEKVQQQLADWLNDSIVESYNSAFLSGQKPADQEDYAKEDGHKFEQATSTPPLTKQSFKNLYQALFTSSAFSGAFDPYSVRYPIGEVFNLYNNKYAVDSLQTIFPGDTIPCPFCEKAGVVSTHIAPERGIASETVGIMCIHDCDHLSRSISFINESGETEIKFDPSILLHKSFTLIPDKISGAEVVVPCWSYEKKEVSENV